MIELRNKLFELLPLLNITNDRRRVIFQYAFIEHDYSYIHITECGYYSLIKKLMNRIVELINEDRTILDRDFEKDVFPQLIRELRREKLNKILH